ncbi:MAG: hypothetical protein JXB48_11215 [Candidatus Latescibacteria bacterium]|nr:hypothetical protein [Candidatus Latescibacterota bacterium]
MLTVNGIKINDNYPTPPLYRFFKFDQYAEDFINGHIRLGWLKKYRDIEDNRQDKTEGESKHTFDDPDQLTITIDQNTGKEISRKRGRGITEITSNTSNQFYILCTSELNKNNTSTLLRERFKGEKIKQLPRYAEIYDIELFTKKIAEALGNSKYAKFINNISWFQCEYTKGKKRLKRDPDLFLDMYQKPENDFIIEQEWRLAALINDSNSFGLTPEETQNTMYIQGEARKERIAQDHHITLKDLMLTLKNYPDHYEIYEEETYLWIDTIIVNHPCGFSDCVRLLDK